MKKGITLLAFAALFVCSGVNAALISLQVEGGGTAQVYELNDGSFLGLMGFDNRDRSGYTASDVTIASFGDLADGFTSGQQNIMGFYNGTNPVNAGAVEFDALVYGFNVAAGARLFDSLWVNWSGGNLVYGQPYGGTTTLSANVTRQGDPLATSATNVSEPGMLTLMLLGLATIFGRKIARR